MDIASEHLEKIWENLLSGHPELIRSTYDLLDSVSRETVLTHLQHMANDPGWQPEQREMATKALKALKKVRNQGG